LVRGGRIGNEFRSAAPFLGRGGLKR